MADWQTFAAAAPSLADRVRTRFTSAESHILATLRRDGSPRVSGSEVNFQGTSLYIGSMSNAVKARDLLRDPRFALHAHPGDPTTDGDAKLAGLATEVTDPVLVAQIVGGGEQSGGEPGGGEGSGGEGSGGEQGGGEQAVEEQSHLFHLDIREAALTWVADNTLFVESWKEGRGLVRFARPDNGPAIRTDLD
ncbi:pyridoxamine 5'-phosphate oxidase family protein [Amycolatopsis saalfeldensis]|uniref:Pyridoxamine 5'-phosphate oxidase n=1 Tax=Amycolatopsis saalfeldensis TaxID=394193 RepID=A0A1H8X676_9PSEU|nr:pyridoxamine 5'-phosphate oxidase family protein [Amycolatopsis saalfeldensis]SEP35399.1 Pyridoxamine 5'-phosphate oxidase [Amycolatopsis saalfeldensis]